MRILLLFICAKLMIPMAVAAETELVSKVVGRAGDYYITSREVEIGYIIEQARKMKGEKAVAKNLNIKSGDKEFRRELNGSLIEWIVAKEASSFSVAKISKKQREQEFSKVRKNLAKFPRWKQLRVSENELTEFLLRKIRAQTFVRFKTESSYIKTSDEEALDFYQKNKQRFSGLPFKQSQDKIRSYLDRKKRNERLRSWFETLQKKYKVRVLL